MTTVDHEIDILAVLCHCLLGFCDRWSRLECGAEDHITSVADAAENAAGMVRLLHDLISIHTEFIVIFRSARFRRGKSVSDLKTFDSTDREDRFCEVGIQFFEYRLTETDRKTGDHTLDNSADRVAFCDFLIQVAFGFFCSFSVRETEPVVLDFRKIHALRGYLYRSDRFRIGSHRDI